MKTQCRACLSSPDLILMGESLINKYNVISNLDIKYREDMPLYLCKTCFDALNFCIDFREKCISSDMRLKEMMIKQMTKIEELPDTVIKEEIKVEYDSDPNFYENDNDASSDDDMKLSELKEAKSPQQTIIKNETVTKRSPKNNIRSKKVSTSKPNGITKKDPIKTIANLKRKLLVDILEVEDSNLLIDCGLCLKQFENMPLLLKHLEDHTDSSCEICSDILDDFTHVLAHRITHVSEQYKKCHLCPKKIASALAAEYHFIKIHNFRGEDGHLQCKLCSKPYKTLTLLQKHIHAVHREKIFKCEKCDKWFRLKAELRSHMYTHVEAQPFKCELCDFSTKRLSGIRAHHRRKHSAGKIVCKPCGKIFASESLRDSHKCNCAKEVICTVCGVTVTKLKFRRHMQKHQGKKFACNLCPAQFKGRSSLKAHMDRHQGVKRNQCEFCQMKFYSPSSLIRHRRIHTGEKPHKCNLCDSAFPVKYNLKVHMKVHGLDLVVRGNSKQPYALF